MKTDTSPSVRIAHSPIRPFRYLIVITALTKLCDPAGMPLPLEDITRIARAVALAYRRELEVVAVTPSAGGSDRVELLIDVMGCHEGPCRISLNLNRADGEDFERDLKGKLDEAFRTHFPEA